jgi:hypothetical protein
MRPIFLLISILIYGLTSCRTVKPALPDNEVSAIPPIVNKYSAINLPIEIDLTPYLNDVEKSLDKTFKGKEDNCSGVSYSYRFERNPIKFDGSGAMLNYEVSGKYALNLNYCPECTFLFDSKGSCVVPRVYASCGVGEPMRRVKVAYSTTVDVSKELQLRAKTELTKFETIDPCEITVFKYDATEKLRKEVTGVLKDLEKDIDKSISEVDIKSEVAQVWKLLSEPMPINGYGFLTIQPKELALSSVDFNKKKAFIDLNLIFQPVFTTRNPGIQSIPLPKLSEFKKGNGFAISMDVLATYDSLTNILNREISGTSLNIKNKEIIFDSVSIAGSNGNKLNIMVKFSGKKRGVLYLTGTPTFDAAEQFISFPDLEFDIKTKSALLKSAEWLFSPKITDLFRQQAQFDLKPHLEKMRSELNIELNKELTKGVFLDGTIEKINLEQIYPSEEMLILRLETSGKLKIKM